MFRLMLILLFLTGGLLPLQAQGEFSVRHVYVISDVNSRYILTAANRLIPQNEVIGRETVGCFVTYLMESLLFDDIGTELVPVKGERSFDLLVRPKYKVEPNTLVVKKIKLNKSLGLDNGEFNARLGRSSIIEGMSFNPYTEIERSIAQVIEDIAEESNARSPEIWINVKVIESNSVELDITNNLPNCVRP